MFRRAVKWAGRPLWNLLKARIDARIQQRLDAQGYRPYEPPPPPPPPPDLSGLQVKLFIPPCPPLWAAPAGDRFMPWSTCSFSDFTHPRYAQLCEAIRHAPVYHRKAWEWIFVIHHLTQAGVLKEGSRGLGFGVGLERLPALFAKLGAQVVATDAPADIGQAAGWAETGQHSAALESLRYPEIVDAGVFDRKVTYQPCDMNNIPRDLRDFDFTWSCCCFEHLGSLEAGMQFVINSVEKTLKVGGVACHTTEFNLLSNEHTVSEGGTVLYRRRDMDELVRRLRERGHAVQPFAVAPDSHYLDGFVDVPPYRRDFHIKLALEGYVATSAGIVVTRGR